MMDKALFIAQYRDIKFLTSEHSRIYFGVDSCENLLPTKSEISRVINVISKNNLKLSFVTPLLTNAGIKTTVNILNYLVSKIESFEVIVNDFGLLNIIINNYKNLSPVLGRVIIKQYKDLRLLTAYGINNEYKIKKHDGIIRLSKYGKISRETLRNYMDLPINISSFIKFMAENRISRVEIDNTLHGIDIYNRPWAMSLYVPYGILATTRLCSPKIDAILKKNHCYISNCSKKCKNNLYMLKYENEYPNVIKKGNTMFFRNDKIPNIQKLESLGIDRIIYQPRIPM